MRARRQEASGISRAGWLWGAGVFLTSFLIFSGTFSYPFVHDDLTVITINPVVQKERLLEAFATDYWGMRKGDQKRDRLYRPITTLSLAVNHAWGGNRPAGYRVINTTLHALAAVLFFWMCLHFGLGMGAAGAAGLLFALHPIHTEAVNAVVGRADLFAAIGVFAGMGILLGRAFAAPEAEPEEKPGRKRGKKFVPEVSPPRGNYFPVTVVGLWFALALFAKEVGAALAIWAALWWAWRRWALGAEQPADRRALACAALVLGAVLAIYLGMRFWALGMWVRPTLPSRLDNSLAYAGLAGRWAGALGVLGRYLYLLVWPRTLSIDYSYAQILPGGADTLQWAGAGAVVLALWAMAAWRWRADVPGVAFGLMLFLASYLPVSNFLLPIGTVMAERLMYLPSAGFILAVVSLAASCLDRRAMMGFVALGAVAVLFFDFAWKRNKEWASPLRLWEAAAKASPRSARSLRLYGQSLYASGDFDKAIPPLRKATQIYPIYDPAWVDLGIAQMQSRREGEAEKSLHKALRLNPDSPEGHLSLGVLFLGTGRRAQARRHLERAVGLAPGLVEAHFNLGTLYLRDGKRARAVEQFRAALRADPRRGDVHHNLAIALFMSGKSGEARRHAQMAMRLGVRLHPELARKLGIRVPGGARR